MTRIVRRFKRLEVNRVDLVDRGACRDPETNDGSHILIAKRETSERPPVPPAIERAERALLSAEIAELVRVELAKERPPMEATISKAEAVELLKSSSKGLDERAVRRLSEQIADSLGPDAIYRSVKAEARELMNAGRFSDELDALDSIWSDRSRRHVRLAWAEAHKLRNGRMRQVE